jgi:hypothetical protein
MDNLRTSSLYSSKDNVKCVYVAVVIPFYNQVKLVETNLRSISRLVI